MNTNRSVSSNFRKGSLQIMMLSENLPKEHESQSSKYINLGYQVFNVFLTVYDLLHHCNFKIYTPVSVKVSQMSWWGPEFII